MTFVRWTELRRASFFCRLIGLNGFSIVDVLLCDCVMLIGWATIVISLTCVTSSSMPSSRVALTSTEDGANLICFGTRMASCGGDGGGDCAR